MPWGISILCRVARFFSLVAGFALCSIAQANTIEMAAGIDVYAWPGGSVLIEQPGRSPKVCTEQGYYADSCSTSSSPTNNGDVFTFTARPDPGYVFVQWTSDGSPAGSNPVLTRGPFNTVVPSERLEAEFQTCKDTDDDGDGVICGDQCPNTPAGESVDPSTGCPATSSGSNDAPIDFGQFDSDGDGVINASDQCPTYWDGKTPVNEVGCTEAQRDDDEDGVRNGWDSCPATPAGAEVDAEGCSEEQRDEDQDGVGNTADQCPATPEGEAVDAEGCGNSQKDEDVDGVSNKLDLCPATPEGETVDADGCAESQRDADSDGVSDAADQCPSTISGDAVDENGCSEGQRDDDGDGVANADDACAATRADRAVNEDGCSAVQEQLADLGEDLADLDGLDEDGRSLADAIDGACERLIRLEGEATEGAAGALTRGQQDLKAACSSLKSSNTTSDQQLAGLASISPQLLTNRIDAVVETASRQFQQVTQRLNRIKGGAGSGLSLAGLTLNFAGEVMPGALLEEAADQAGAGELGPDFGNWGLYLQGDIDVTERRDTDARRQYDEDAWLLTLGADYRFNPSLYAGLAVSFGETETDYADAQSDTETTALTAYGGWQFSDAGFLDLQFSWADDDYDMSRDVTYLDAGGNFTSTYRGSAGGSHLTAAANLGYMFSVSGWRIGPTASYFYLDGEVDGYREEALGDASKAWELSVGQSNFEKSILRLGLQLDYAWLTDFGVVMPGLILNYVSESNSGDATTGAQLANDVQGFGQLIDIQRETLDGQYWDASFNLAGQFAYGFSGFASYRITAGRDGYQHRGYTLGLRWDQAF